MGLRYRFTLGVLAVFYPCDGAQMFETPAGIVFRSVSALDDGKEIGVHDAHGSKSCTEYLMERRRAEEPAVRVSFSESELSSERLRLARGKVSFLFLSDTQQNQAEHWKAGKIAGAWIDRDPSIQFVLNAGDLVHWTTEYEYRQYRRASERYAIKVPIVPVIGNHEYYGDRELERRNSIYGHPSTARGFYSLDYGTFVLLVLNSNIEAMGKQGADDQTAWLKETLKAQREAGRTVLVAMHHPAHSSGFGMIWMYWNPKYIRRHWQPLFEEYGVRLVLSGHEHVYERLQTGSVPAIVAGPVGGSLARVRPGGSGYSVFRAPAKRTLTRIEVESGGRIDVQTIDIASGDEIDRAVYEP